MKRLMILDTNVLLTDPHSIFKFEENDILIPMVVLEELDNFKSEDTSRGRAARECSRLLDGVRKRGSLHEGVVLEEGGILKVDCSVRRPTYTASPKNDDIILQTAIDYQGEPSDAGTDYDGIVLVTKDINLRVRGDALGITVEDYKNHQVKSLSVKSATKEFYVSFDTVQDLYQDGATHSDIDIEVNEYAVLNTDLGPSALVRKMPSGLIHPLYERESVYKLSPRNNEQRFLFDALLDPNIHMVAVHGSTGSGKTLLSTAAALEQVSELGIYEKVVIARPTVAMGADLGYLPGSLSEKLAPWTAPFYDAADVLFKKPSKKKEPFLKGTVGTPPMKALDYLVESGQVEFESLQHIRGRSFRNCFIIIDEAQNLSLHEAKTIITRVGEGSKIVFQGDLDQIDVPYLDRNSSGLAHLLARFRGQDIVSCPILTKTERSRLAELAGELL
jgi:PhoH-like ATPase